jgi:Flp pilus assembly protein TadG
MVNEQDERKRTSEYGQSLVEFSTVMVVLMLLLTGVGDGARALYAYLSIRDAVQEGAAYASIQPLDITGAENRVRGASDYMDSLGDSIAISITPVVSGPQCSGIIKVTVDYPQFPLVMPLIGTIIGSQTIPISASVTDTILKPKCP